MYILVVYVCATFSPDSGSECRWVTITSRPLETRQQCEELAKKVATTPSIVRTECRDPSDAP